MSMPEWPNIDCLVTERGIAINPLRKDLLKKLKKTKLKIYPIKELARIAHNFTNIPRDNVRRDIIIGEVEDRTYQIIDHIYQK